MNNEGLVMRKVKKTVCRASPKYLSQVEPFQAFQLNPAFVCIWAPFRFQQGV